MKNRKFILLISFISGLTNFLPTLHAQEWKLMTREEIEAKVHPKLLQQGRDILCFDTCRQSVDTLKEEDEPRTVTFRFRNCSPKPVRITRINTSCGCTGAEFSREVLAPKEESSIQLTFHPKNRPGTVDADAWVYTDASDQAPVARLSLSGYVQTDDEWKHLPQSMGHLKLSRKQIIFSPIGEKLQERIACANSDDQPMKLKALLHPSYITFHTDPPVLQPGQEGDLVITLDRKKMPSSTADEKKLSLILDGVTGKPSERTIEIIIKN